MEAMKRLNAANGRLNALLDRVPSPRLREESEKVAGMREALNRASRHLLAMDIESAEGALDTAETMLRTIAKRWPLLVAAR